MKRNLISILSVIFIIGFLTTNLSAQTCTYTISETNQAFGPAGGSDNVSINAGSDCTWTATASDSWIAIDTSTATGTGNGIIEYTVLENTDTIERTGTINISDADGATVAILTVTQEAGGVVACSYSISSTSETLGSAEQVFVSVGVTATSGCTWVAASNDTWITIDSGNTGIGNGIVSYSFTENTDTTERTGTINISDADGATVATLTVIQEAAGVTACTYTITETNQAFGPAGGSDSVGVTADSGCSWTASASNSWIVVPPTFLAGTGNGIISYRVSENTDTTERTGTINISDANGSTVATVTVTQDATATDDHGDDCSTATTITDNSTTNAEINTGGDYDYFRVDIASSGTLTVYTSGDNTDTEGFLNDSSCSTLTSDDQSGENNNFQIVYLVSVGTYYVAVKSYYTEGTGAYTLHLEFVSGSGPATTDDHGDDCSTATTITNNSTTYAEINTGGDYDYFRVDFASSGTLIVYTSGNMDTEGFLNDSSCSTLKSDDQSGENNNFQIVYSVSAGTYYVAVRSYYIDGFEATGAYTLHLKFVTGPGCTYTILPTRNSFDSSGGTGSVSVTAGSGCDWTAYSNVSWITIITSGSSGRGDGTVNYSVSENTGTGSGTGSRTGTMTIAENTFAVIQSATSSTDDLGTDDDGDGYTENEGDCDDEDPDINPAAIDIANNGVDEDCDGMDKTDDYFSAPTGFSYSVKCTSSIFDLCTTTTEWNEVSGASGYKLYYGYSSGNYSGSSDIGNVTSVSFGGIPEGTYYLALTAYDSSGNETDKSEELVMIISDSLSTPTDFSATTSDCNEFLGSMSCTINLSWSYVSASSGYNLYFGYSSGDYAGSVDMGDATSMSFEGIPEGTYYLALTAYGRNDEESGYSNEVELFVGESSVPTNFTATTSDCVNLFGSTSCTISFNWTGASGADGYNLYYGFSSGDYLGPLDLGNTTSQSFSGIPDGTYYFAVTAYAGPDESDYSNEASVTINVQ